MDKPLVTQVCWSLGRAGAERMVFDLAKRLPEQGFDVRVIAAGRGGDMLQDFHAADIPVAVGPDTRDRRLTLGFLRTRFAANRPQILHTHLGADIWAGYLAWRHRIRPWIITAHSAASDDAFLPSLLHALAFRRADRVACVSESVRKFVITKYKVREDRAVVIPSGVEIAGTRGRHPFQDVPRLIFVGRLVASKNLPVLLRALAPIKRPWRLEIFGDGPMRNAWERLSEELGILPRVSFRGQSRDVPSELARADLFCFPTQHEGQGLALFEAAAAGVPAIASDLPVFREAFDEQSIAFADPLSPDAWTRAIERTLDNPHPALARASVAQRIVSQRYSVARMVRQYADLYRKLLGR